MMTENKSGNIKLIKWELQLEFGTHFTTIQFLYLITKFGLDYFEATGEEVGDPSIALGE